MTLVFVTNYINHHQVHLADEFYKIFGDDYAFISTIEMYEFRKLLGYPDFSDRSYLVKAYMSDRMKLKSLQLAYDADVVIIGSAPEEYVAERIKAGKLTFRYSERWFKTKAWYLSGPRAWLNFYKNHIKYRNKPLYILAASAYTANDVYAIGAYKDKVYKWGYFTAVPECFCVEESKQDVSTLEITPQIMWCGRYLKWKHPELPVMLAARLKKEGYRFSLNMYGSGEELEPTKSLTQDLDVEDVVSFCGNLSNQKILSEMRRHQIFLFTSDKNEGWGAVLNESMGNGCAVVASNRIGATPFLIKDGENGLIFESENLDSLYSKVKSLLDDEELRKSISRNAHKTMSEMWNPKNAAQCFLRLVKALQAGEDTPFVEGPCSKAYPFEY